MSISSIHDGSLEFECSDSPDRSPVCPGNSGRVVLPFTPRAGKVGFRYPIEASISGGSVQEDAASGMDEDNEGGGTQVGMSSDGSRVCWVRCVWSWTMPKRRTKDGVFVPVIHYVQ